MMRKRNTDREKEGNEAMHLRDPRYRTRVEFDGPVPDTNIPPCCATRDERFRKNLPLLTKLANATIFRAEILANEEWNRQHPYSPSLTRCDFCGREIGKQGGKIVKVFTSYEKASRWMDNTMAENERLGRV